ncbi:hypothetical protein [Synechococcus sp. CS-1328]|uniref:hypothetical protein n=1 Tax=Synechococcus sp. CS-1328 TaxID=2847976 RepID=UPI00223AA812|nr:hypothetical protein [Synechococcus sp. CS-1328]MCT0226100.1 hypothetical protein [Synechococcus sp. CS-1328]
MQPWAYTVRGQLFFVSSIDVRQGVDVHEHLARVSIDMAAEAGGRGEDLAGAH